MPSLTGQAPSRRGRNRGKCADEAKGQHLPPPRHTTRTHAAIRPARNKKGGRRPLLGLPFPTTGGRRYFTVGSQKAYPVRPDFPRHPQTRAVEPRRAILAPGRYIYRPKRKSPAERLLGPSTAILHAYHKRRIAPDAREGAFLPFQHLGR